MPETNYQNDLTFDEKLMISIVGAAENFKRAHSALFKKYGLSFPQYNILRVLEASDRGQNTISGVGKIMLVPGANMTGLARRLENKGFVLRKADPDDKRYAILEITKMGRESLKRIEAEKNKSYEIILMNLGPADKKDVLDKIRKMIRSTAELNKILSR